MGFFIDELYYSKKTGFSKNAKIMTVAQREQLHKIYKRYAIRRFKESGNNYDGVGYFSKYEVNLHTGGAFWGSVEYENWALRKKYNVIIYNEDKDKIGPKAATLIRSAGYKVEVGNTGTLYLWKPKK